MDAAQLTTAVKDAIADAIVTLTAVRAGAKNHAQAPEHYDGQRATYETFRRGLDLYVKAIPRDTEKIWTAITFLTKGDADAWAQNFVQDHTTSIEDGSLHWDEFLSALDKKFLDPRVAEHAREALFRLTQGRQEADNFFLKFDELRVKGGLVNAEHHDKLVVEYLKKAMSPALVLAVGTAFEAQKRTSLDLAGMLLRNGVLKPAQYAIELVRIDKDISYKTFRDLAIEHDPAVRRHGQVPTAGYPRVHHAEPRRAPTVTSYTSTTSSSTSTTPPAPQYSAVPAAAAAPTPRPRDPDAMEIDRSRMRASQICYRCRKPGHIARDCKENDMREVIRGLTDMDLREIASIVRDRESTPLRIEGPSQDFPDPQ